MKVSKIEDNRSFVPIRIAATFNDTEIAIGTAFFYALKEKEYLVTNWHNVTGRRPSDHKPISKSAAIPDKLTLWIPFNEKVNERSAVRWKQLALRLYEDEDNLKAKWFEHPEHGNKVDAVAIELGEVHSTAAITANCSSLDLYDLRLHPGMDIFILGYPRGISGGGKFPIWKRGSIASEPDIDIDNLPLFYVDSATREGMSGSPVYAQVSGFWAPKNGKLPDDGVMGRGEQFVGIYSGRILAEDPFLAQLGLVWKEEAIIQIIESAKHGISSFELSPKKC